MINNIKYFSHKDFTLDNNIYNIVLVVTYNCDLKCSYCSLHNEENYSTKEKYIKIVDFINSMVNDYDIVKLTLFGGECTQHPNFLDILDRLDNNIYIRLETNLSYDINYLKQIVNTNKINEYHISYHYNIVDEDLFYNNYLYLKDNMNNNYTINTILMMEKKYVNDIFELQKTKYKNSIINQVKDCNVWTIEEYYDILNKSTKQIINDNIKHYNDSYIVKNIDNSILYINKITIDLNNLRNFKYFKCDVIKHLIFISSNGDIYPCELACRNCNKLDLIGNIIKDNNIIEKLKKAQNKNHICKYSYCCQIDIPKTRIINNKIR